jgi:recombination protein RecA
MSKLKDAAKAFSQYINNEYKGAVSYTPDTAQIALVTVNKWVELNQDIQDAIELPGLPFGVITCVYGKPDTGKTTLLMEGIAACQRKGVLPILILSEHKFDFDRLGDWMGADPSEMVVLHADTLEQGYSYIEKILKEVKNGKLIVEQEKGEDVIIDMTDLDCFIFWDSIGNTLSTSQLDYEVEEWAKNMGKHAQGIKAMTKRANYLISKVRGKVGILFLNQSYTSMPSYGPPVETPYGGDGVPYSSALVIRTRRKGDLKVTTGGKEGVIGLETLLEVKKNHITNKKVKGSVYTVASGMIAADPKALDANKKWMLKRQKELDSKPKVETDEE